MCSGDARDANATGKCACVVRAPTLALPVVEQQTLTFAPAPASVTRGVDRPETPVIPASRGDQSSDVPAKLSPLPLSQPDVTAVVTPTVWSVSQLTGQLKNLLERSFGDVWVRGEVSGLKPSPAGHVYFDLKENDALLNCVMFRGTASKCKFRIDNGMELIVHGRVDVYAPRGKYSLIVDTAEPQGVGALQVAFEQLKAKLAAEGLFDAARKVAIPVFPRVVGVVTSPTGAAVRDILNVLRRRAPGVHVLLAPAKVQGEGAAAEIASAIALLDASERCDVVIVGRGGGSMEDLWAFNEEPVARAIFACRTPIVSAVGHEIDWTIADFVADLRAPTPSAAAELVAPAHAELLAKIVQARRGLQMHLRRWWEMRAQRTRDLTKRLKSPLDRIATALLRVDHARERMIACLRERTAMWDARVSQARAELEHLSPRAVLQRGYAVIANDNARVIRTIRGLQVGAQIRVQLCDGMATARIESCQEEKI